MRNGGWHGPTLSDLDWRGARQRTEAGTFLNGGRDEGALTGAPAGADLRLPGRPWSASSLLREFGAIARTALAGSITNRERREASRLQRGGSSRHLVTQTMLPSGLDSKMMRPRRREIRGAARATKCPNRRLPPGCAAAAADKAFDSQQHHRGARPTRRPGRDLPAPQAGHPARHAQREDRQQLLSHDASRHRRDPLTVNPNRP